jgi:hypothetical protein
MAMNANVIKRISDRKLFLWAAILFPLVVLVGYFKTYYFSAFFDVRPIANALVHVHAVIMSLWVAYFAAQVALVRSKNIKLHMTLGMAGIVLAAVVVVVGLATAYDSQVIRGAAPPGFDPRVFFVIPVSGMLMFVLFFGGAIYYRKRPAEHKTLMLMTAINFMPPALDRVPFFPEQYAFIIGFSITIATAVGCLVWHSLKHGRVNKIFLGAIILFIAVAPLRMIFAHTQMWLGFVDWLAGLRLLG